MVERLRAEEEPGFTDTNAHAYDCSFSLSAKSICCIIGEIQGECLEEAEVCSIDSECCDAYCSYGEYEQQTEGHCCLEGDLWNPDYLPTARCVSANPCYPYICGFTMSNLPGYLNDPNCMKNSTATKGFWEACCMNNWYGTTGQYYYCPVTAL